MKDNLYFLSTYGMKYKFGNGDSCKKIEKIILKKHRLNKGNVKWKFIPKKMLVTFLEFLTG